MDLTFQVPIILLFTASDFASITSHPQLATVFALAPSLHSFWSYFSTDLQQHIGHYQPGESYHFVFSYCSWGSQGKCTEVVCHSLLQWTTFCQTSPPWPVRLGWPHTAWLSFIELDTTVVLWSDWLVSVIIVLVCLPSDALSQHLPSYLGFSYLGRGVSLYGCSSKAQPYPTTVQSSLEEP